MLSQSWNVWSTRTRSTNDVKCNIALQSNTLQRTLLSFLPCSYFQDCSGKSRQSLYRHLVTLWLRTCTLSATIATIFQWACTSSSWTSLSRLLCPHSSSFYEINTEHSSNQVEQRALQDLVIVKVQRLLDYTDQSSDLWSSQTSLGH